MKSNRKRQGGFTMIEMTGVLAVTMILSALATFSFTDVMLAYQAGLDARSIQSQVALARMRASSAFDQAQVSFNQDARTYQIELQNKATLAYAIDAGTSAAFLSRGVNFGFGNISTPAGEQATIYQSTTIRFNSRGVPVDASGAPTGDYAIYLTSANGLTYAVTVSRSGRVNMWEYVGSAWVLR